MAAGLQVWDEFGRPLVEITDRMTRVLGLVDTGGSNGSVSHVGFASGSSWFHVLTPAVGLTADFPNIVISGNTLSWTYTYLQYATPVQIVYGVY